MIQLDDPDAPKYWIQTGGKLPKVVKRYLNGYTLTEAEVYLMRVYLWQWVKSSVWAPSGVLKALRLRVAAIAGTTDLAAAIEAMVELGMNPL